MTCRRVLIVLTAVGFLCLPIPARAQFDAERITSYAELEVKSSLITGTIWLDRGSLESIQVIDRDGDFEYSFEELNAARPFFDAYLERNFLVMWGQHIAPPRISNIAPATRPRAMRPLFRIDFRMTDLPPNQPITVASRLLSDLSPQARTFLRVRREGRDELCVLGLTNCYRTDRTVAPIPRDGAYRPEAQRGRVAPIGELAFEMLYALPESALHLYILQADQNTPLAVADKTMSVLIQPGKEGTYRPLTFTAKPLSCDKAGQSSHFVCPAPEYRGVTTFNADITLGAGIERKRVIFEFPAIAIPPPDTPQTKRWACPNLCPGIELKEGGAKKCPRCGATLVELFGESVPGLGLVGPHGGLLMLRPPEGEVSFEAVVTPANEFRVWLTNGRFEKVPIGKLTGSVFCSTDERFQQTIVELVLKSDPGGRYLAARIPETTPTPVHTRLVYDFHDGKPAAQVDFFFPTAIPLEGAATQPSTSAPSSQPSVPAASSQPSAAASQP